MMAARTSATLLIGVAMAAVSASMAVTGAREAPGLALQDIAYARETLAPLARRPGTPPLTPQQAVEALQSRGFRDISAPQRRGGVAIVAATASRGERITLVIDLASGEVAGLRLKAPASADSKRR